MHFKILKLLVFILNCDLIAGQGFFSVTGSDSLNHGQTYRVNVACNGFSPQSSTLLEIAVVSRDTRQNRLIAARNITLDKGGSSTIELDTKNFPIDSYSLRVRSLTGPKFEQFKLLAMIISHNVFLIQTDKALYKPTDKVQFRVLAINTATRPLSLRDVSIVVKDGAQNRVKQFDKATFTKGVFEGELQLSELAVLGFWRIDVKQGSTEVSKPFEVAKYTAPSFNLEINTPADAHSLQAQISVMVKATYALGQPVKGNLTVTAQLQGHSTKVSKTLQSEGKSSIDFDMVEDLKIPGNFGISLVLIVSFVEELTGREQKATKSVKIHPSANVIVLEKKSERFKTTLPFDVTAIVKSSVGDTPVTDPVGVVFRIIYYKCFNPTTGLFDVPGTPRRPYGAVWFCHEREINQTNQAVPLINGLAKLSLTIQEKEISRIAVMASYQQASVSTSAERVEMCSQEYIQLKQLTHKPKVGSALKFNVRSSKPITEVNIQIIIVGRDVAISRNLKSKATVSFDFDFKLTADMSTGVTVIAHYFTVNGEIVSDRISVGLSLEVKNFLEVGLSSNQTGAGNFVNISVSTQRNSFVGLLAVDQRVLTTQSGNDITKQSVESSIRSSGTTRLSRINSDFYANGEYSKYNFEENFVEFPLIITNAIPPCKQKPFGYRNCDVRSMWYPTEVAIRKEFPETWFFDSLNFKKKETSATLSKKVPDTITSWIISGFSMNPETGLAFTNAPSKLTVFRLFFIDINLPYSVKRGEIMTLPFQVFNNMDEDQEAEVTLFNSDEDFEFVEVFGNQDFSLSDDIKRIRTVTIKAHGSVTVPFMIRPNIVGNINIKATATVATAGDGLERRLLVEAEGVTQYMNKAIFIDLTKSQTFKSMLEIEVPSNAVQFSTRIEASVIGDILGPTLENLENLLQMPYGCGEQNMLNFVPNIIVLDYLISVKKLTPDISVKAIHHLRRGYQTELSYKRLDGSFSAFNHDKFGSTWLTAYVVKFFNMASNFIAIDASVLVKAYQFLQNSQNADGSFKELGTIRYINQGGSSAGLAFSAYVLITFLEDKKASETYSSTVSKGINFVAANFDNLTDIYAIAISAYALQLAKHPKRGLALAKLDAKATKKGDMKYWEKTTEKMFRGTTSPMSVEMTSYALQAYLEAGLTVEAIPIMRWLISHRNAEGGFYSTQDTIVGLRGLSKIAAKIHSDEIQMEITISHKFSSPTTVKVNKSNMMMLQKFEMASQARKFSIQAKGRGMAILEIAYRYNLASVVEFPRFKISPTITVNSNNQHLHLHVCASFIPDTKASKSNMALMEVTLPSGFTFAGGSLAELKKTKYVKKVEIKKEGTFIVIYFDDLSSTPVCLAVNAYRTSFVALLKPASIVVLDYYDLTRLARIFYKVPATSLCNICQGAEECVNSCAGKNLKAARSRPKVCHLKRVKRVRKANLRKRRTQ